MNDQTITQLLLAFGRSERVLNWKPFGHGHINDTYLVITANETDPNFILQRKNHQIFKNIPGMLNNILLATNHIRKPTGK